MNSVSHRAPFLIAFLLVLVHGESPQDAATQGESPQDAATASTNDEEDPTKQLLKQLTIGMMEVVDERTVLLRPTSTKDGKRPMHLRLGNVGAPVQGSLSDGEYAEKVGAAKAALAKLVDKQALWYKAAPENVQSPSSNDDSPQVIVADLWNRGGFHINTALKKEGHLADVQEYESEIAKDILGAAAKGEKEESYKKLGDAMKEHQEEQEAKRKADKAAGKGKAEEEETAPESFGLAGWLGVALLVSLGFGIATNFGQRSSKKTNLNRKKGTFEKFWMRLKGE